MATKRTLRKPEELRELIENSGLKYVMINNRIFDDFLEKGGNYYSPKKVIDEKNKKEEWKDHEGKVYEFSQINDIYATFDERDLILFIFLKFLEQQEFSGYTQEIADYLRYSDKRIKPRLNKLEFLTGSYNHLTNENEIQEKRARLINKKNIKGYENGKKRSFNKWYVTFNCDYKKEVDHKTGELKFIPENFFIITIYDLDLYTKGILNEKEFITYLYLIRSYDSKKEKAISQRISTISSKINIKNSSITELIFDRLINIRIKDKFCSVDEDLPLIHVSKPANFSKKILIREEPSYYFDPIYNRTTIQKIDNLKVTTGYENEEDLFVDIVSTNTDTQYFDDSHFVNSNGINSI